VYTNTDDIFFINLIKCLNHVYENYLTITYFLTQAFKNDDSFSLKCLEKINKIIKLDII